MGTMTVTSRPGIDAECPVTIPNTDQEDLTGGTGSGGSPLVIQDEGIQVDPDVSLINFVGAGVTASSSATGEVVVTIPGGTLLIEDEGVSVDTATATLNFTGTLVTASQTSPGVVQVAVGGSTLTAKDEGITVDSAVATLNFTGAGVTASQTSAGVVEVSVPSFTVKDEGSTVDSAVTTLNFTGSTVTATQTSAGVVKVDVVASGDPWSLQWRPYDNEPPLTDYARLDTRNYRPMLKFDTTTQQTAMFSGVLPSSYSGAGVIVEVWCALASATSGTVGWDVAFERIDASSLDLDSDSFGSATTITATTVPGTSGQVLKLSCNVSNGSSMDSLAAGEAFRLRIRRDVANDTATGDAELYYVNLRSQ